MAIVDCDIYDEEVVDAVLVRHGILIFNNDVGDCNPPYPARHSTYII